MNAYELADELWEKYLDNNECQHGYALSNGCPNDDCKEQALYDSATMLRQQADRIAELEKNASRYQFLVNNPHISIDYTGELTLDEFIDKQIKKSIHIEPDMYKKQTSLYIYKNLVSGKTWTQTHQLCKEQESPHCTYMGQIKVNCED